MADVVTLDGEEFIQEKSEEKPILHRPSDQLRLLADRIDAQEYGEIEVIGLALMGNSFEVFGYGKLGTSAYVVGVFEAGILRLVKQMEQHGQ